MIFVDSHVHIYDCFDVDILLDSALNNFQKAAKKHNTTGQASVYVLLLTETKNESWFERSLANFNSTDQENGNISKNWRGAVIEQSDVLLASRNDSPEAKIYIVAGHQIVTKEKIEVLALYSRQTISDGLSLAETVNLAVQENAIPVLPWGVGKWFGTRGKTIQSFLDSSGTGRLYLGDNGGRPGSWPTPTLFHVTKKKGISVLPGTDALPLERETSRVGSFGFYLDDSLSDGEAPCNYLKNVLLAQDPAVTHFGRLQNSSLFLLNQLRLRFSS